MKLLIDRIANLTAAGHTVAVSTVVETVGSSPREVGASMALTDSGVVLGSLSGGCLEADVLGQSEEVLEDGTTRACTYGPSDSSELFAVGLTCGGLIDIVIRRFGPEHAPLLARIAESVGAGRGVIVASLVDAEPSNDNLLLLDSDSSDGSLGDAGLDDAVISQLPALLSAGWSGVLRLGAMGRRDEVDTEVFIESFGVRPKMLIVGAIDAAEALSRIAREVGYHVIVADPRPVFMTPERFPRADQVVAEWPDRFIESWDGGDDSVVCVLTHDPRIDVPVLLKALRSRAAYVGAMGSARTHLDRTERMIAAGATDAELDRLHSPIGLDIGAATPMEIAISVIAEVVAARSGRSGAAMAVRGWQVDA